MSKLDINELMKEGLSSQERMEDRILATLPYLNKLDSNADQYLHSILQKLESKNGSSDFLNPIKKKFAISALKKIRDEGWMSLDSTSPELAELGGANYYTKINNLYSMESWKEISTILNKIVKNNQIKDVLETLAVHYKEIDKSDDEAMKLHQVEVESKIQQIYNIKGEKVEWVKSIIEKLLDERQTASTIEKLMPTGYSEIDDKLFGGFRLGQLVVIGARPAVGKTALLVNIASRIAQVKVNPFLDESKVENKEDIVNNRYRSVFFSLEMSKEEISDRVTSIETAIPTYQLANPSDIQQVLVNKLIDSMKNDHSEFFIQDDPDVTVEQIESALKEAIIDGHPYSIVFVDYLQLLNGQMMNSRERVSYVSRRLKVIAKKYKVAVIALSQLNREADSREGDGDTLTLSMLRDSGSVEQDADIVMFLSRNDFYDDDSGDQSVVKLQIVKNRSGKQGSVSLSYRKHIQRMDDLTFEDKLLQGMANEDDTNSVAPSIIESADFGLTETNPILEDLEL